MKLWENIFKMLLYTSKLLSFYFPEGWKQDVQIVFVFATLKDKHRSQVVKNKSSGKNFYLSRWNRQFKVLHNVKHSDLYGSHGIVSIVKKWVGHVDRRLDGTGSGSCPVAVFKLVMLNLQISWDTYHIFHLVFVHSMI